MKTEPNTICSEITWWNSDSNIADVLLEMNSHVWGLEGFLNVANLKKENKEYILDKISALNALITFLGQKLEPIIKEERILNEEIEKTEK